MATIFSTDPKGNPDRGANILARVRANNEESVIYWNLPDNQVNELNDKIPVFALDNFVPKIKTVGDLKKIKVDEEPCYGSCKPFLLENAWIRWRKRINPRSVIYIVGAIIASISAFGGGRYLTYLEMSSAQAVAVLVDSWGEMPLEKRKKFRELVNTNTLTCDIKVTCDRDSNSSNDSE